MHQGDHPCLVFSLPEGSLCRAWCFWCSWAGCPVKARQVPLAATRGRWCVPEWDLRLLSSVQFHFVCLKRCGVEGAPLLVGPNCWQTRGPVPHWEGLQRQEVPLAPSTACCPGGSLFRGRSGWTKAPHLGRFVLRLEGNESGNKCNERARGRLRVDRLERLLLCVGVTSVARVSFPRRDQALLEPGNVVPSFCPSREVTQLGTSLFRVLP